MKKMMLPVFLPFILLFASGHSRSDATEVAYHYAIHYKERISPIILKSMLGTLMLGSGDLPQRTKGILTHKRREGQFHPSKRLAWLEETNPISLFGYSFGGTYSVECCSYPILRSEGSYYLVVIDGPGIERAWVNVSTLQKDGYDIEINMLEKLEGKKVNLFLNAVTEARRIYRKPDIGSDSTLLYPSSEEGWTKESEGNYVVFQQKNGFLEVGSIIGRAKKKKVLGWIPVRDKDGLLTLWPMGCSRVEESI